ncbi:beta-lactamase family protein [Mesorhizobium composti]|uniref:Beta-lactamase family protein n=2 Tax=Ollibium composti TaxID=2675109 RepID=A0ABY2Q2N0_9HYPH|nr:beta-lactamase family protein [Mesorhizobium composti]
MRPVACFGTLPRGRVEMAATDAIFGTLQHDTPSPAGGRRPGSALKGKSPMLLLNDLPERRTLVAAVTEVFSRRIASQAAPGARFMVFDASGPAFDGSFGTAGAAGTPPASHGRFRVASCTKSFTAAAILCLRDGGLLSLDAPVTDYVPELKPTLPAGQPEAPTLRLLLSMAGGFPTDDPWADRQESLSNEAFRSVLRAGVRFATAPGTRYEYSNLGYALLGQVIEAVGGRPYPVYVTETLLKPLGLDETGFDFAAVPEGSLATGYRKAGESWVALPFSGPGAFSSIGGIVTTASDLARWAGWLCSAFSPASGEAGPLSAASRREMQRIQCAIVPEQADDLRLEGYGYGLLVEHHARFGLVVSHSGGYPGFSSHMRWNPATGLGVVAMENATYSGAWDPASEALGLILNAAATVTAPAPAAPAAVKRLADGLLRLLSQGWDERTADAIFQENVALDVPYAERARELDSLREKAGALEAAGVRVVATDSGAVDGGYGRFELRVPCSAGEVVAAVRCGPAEPIRVETVTWRVE